MSEGEYELRYHLSFSNIVLLRLTSRNFNPPKQELKVRIVFMSVKNVRR